MSRTTYPADAAGHALHFTWPPEHDHRRHAACTGCPWTAPAPGTGYDHGRRLHTEAHPQYGGRP